LSQQNKTSN